VSLAAHEPRLPRHAARARRRQRPRHCTELAADDEPRYRLFRQLPRGDENTDVPEATSRLAEAWHGARAVYRVPVRRNLGRVGPSFRIPETCPGDRLRAVEKGFLDIDRQEKTGRFFVHREQLLQRRVPNDSPFTADSQSEAMAWNDDQQRPSECNRRFSKESTRLLPGLSGMIRVFGSST